MGSALLNPIPLEPASCEEAADSYGARAAAGSSKSDALRLQVAERLAAHRDRRGRLYPQPVAPRTVKSAVGTRSARIAASVAERFAQTPSYRAFLAAEAERATQQARAAAEVAALNAQVVAKAEQQLLESLYPDSLYSEASGGSDAPGDTEASGYEAVGEVLTLFAEETPSAVVSRAAAPSRKPRGGPQSLRAAVEPLIDAAAPTLSAVPGLTVRLFEQAGAARPLTQLAAVAPQQVKRRYDHADEAEARALDDEISFRQAPVFEEPAGPPTPLPANLIEFPRQLVAPRKVRPRYAEGPLREEDAPEPGGAQLRIFEVEADQISIVPEVADAPMPQWTSLWLDTSGSTAAATHAAVPASVAPQRHPAAIRPRVLAAVVDCSILVAAFLASAGTFGLIALRGVPAGSCFSVVLAGIGDVFTGRSGIQPGLALGAVAASMVFLYVLYQCLFFSLSEATPGMRYARIALCTFTDDNPSRGAMRRRIVAALVSACCFGLGFLWAALDEDSLTWHDLICRMYQRSY